MPASLSIDDRGRVLAEIEDAGGELHGYELAASPPGLSAWAVSMRRLDTGAEHRVAVEPTGRWKCSCMDYGCRKARLLQPCKHIVAARALRALVGVLATSESSHVREPGG